MLEKIIGYILGNGGCMHPFRISRILVLANWKYMEFHNKPMVGFGVKGFEAGFYINELKDVIDSECFVRDESQKCIKYNCKVPKLPRNIAYILDEVIKNTTNLDDITLNKLVIKDPRYKDLLLEGGFRR